MHPGSNRNPGQWTALPLLARVRLPVDAPAIFGAMAIYLAAVLVANATAMTFIPLKLPFDHYPLVSVGTLVFGITFTQRDRVHRAGRPWVYAMLLTTAVAATLQSIVTGVPWRIIVASCLAILLAEAADTEVFHRLRNRRWAVRVVSSNAVSIPLDSLIFNVVAFGAILGLAGVFPASMIAAIIVGDVIAKTVVGAAAATVHLRRAAG